MDFDLAWSRYGREIERIAHHQWVPGMDTDDVMNEMLICLWRATQSYRPALGYSFPAYWWSLWLNRRSDITEAYKALKRVHGIPYEHPPERTVQDVLFPMPPTTDELGVAVWGALGLGDTPSEVQSDLGISRRRYYDVIRRWRTKAVRDHLTD